VDEAARALLREAAHAQDAGVWLKAASAAARAHDWDEAGRALLHARALGAETQPIDDAMAPTTLDFERRAAGSMIVAGSLTWLAWSPSGEHVYVVEGFSRVLRLGVDPGGNVRVFESEGLMAVVPVLEDDLLVLFWEAVEHNRIARFDLATRSISEAHTNQPFELLNAASFGDHVVCVTGGRFAYRFPARAGEIQLEALLVGDGVVTWSGEVVQPPPIVPGGPRTLRFLLAGACFPTRGSVERFVKLATSERVGLTPQEARDDSHGFAVSPSGRHVAFLMSRTNAVSFVDLVSGERRLVELDQTPLDAAWSPSGRRLAVMTDTRVHFLTFTG
jgi:hypothetical protein